MTAGSVCNEPGRHFFLWPSKKSQAGCFAGCQTASCDMAGPEKASNKTKSETAEEPVKGKKKPVQKTSKDDNRGTPQKPERVKKEYDLPGQTKDTPVEVGTVWGYFS